MSEIVDIVDRDDNVIGTASREECHTNPTLIHRAAHFTLIDKKSNKIYLTQRAFHKKTDPGKLCFLGEHVVSGESWEEAAKRGVQEELNADIKHIEEAGFKIFEFPDQTEFVRFFLVFYDGQSIKFDESEIIAEKWLRVDELLAQKDSYSDMTKHWVENVDWNKYVN